MEAPISRYKVIVWTTTQKKEKNATEQLHTVSTIKIPHLLNANGSKAIGSNVKAGPNEFDLISDLCFLEHDFLTNANSFGV